MSRVDFMAGKKKGIMRDPYSQPVHICMLVIGLERVRVRDSPAKSSLSTFSSRDPFQAEQKTK